MEFTAEQIAEMIEGQVEGKTSATINSIGKIEEAESGSLTFLANPKYEEFIYSTEASVALVSTDFEAKKSLPSGLTLIRVAEPYQAFATLLSAYQNRYKSEPVVHALANVDPSASIGENVHIGSGAFIGKECRIGDNTVIHANAYVGHGSSVGQHCEIHANVSIAHDCKVGNWCTLHHGVVIGSDGFGFAPTDTNNYNKVPQIGNVIIEDFVEIGASTCLDRATLGSTIIRKGVKLDNLIQIAHNVEIGENTVIAAQTGIAGSTKIGKNCMIGGQVGIVGHIKIADEVKIAAQSGIQNTIDKPGTIVQGSPAFGIGDYKKSYVGFRRLPQIMGSISDLQKEVEALKTILDQKSE